MKELNDNDLEQVVGGIGTITKEEDIKTKWEKVGIKIIEVNGFTEYYLIKDGSKISPKKALEIYTSNGGII